MTSYIGLIDGEVRRVRGLFPRPSQVAWPWGRRSTPRALRTLRKRCATGPTRRNRKGGVFLRRVQLKFCANTSTPPKCSAKARFSCELSWCAKRPSGEGPICRSTPASSRRSTRRQSGRKLTRSAFIELMARQCSAGDDVLACGSPRKLICARAGIVLTGAPRRLPPQSLVTTAGTGWRALSRGRAGCPPDIEEFPDGLPHHPGCRPNRSAACSDCPTTNWPRLGVKRLCSVEEPQAFPCRVETC